MPHAEVAAHLDREHRKRQHQRDPKSPSHVDQFGIWLVVERDLFGLQRHAADRATARTDLPPVRMHRAGVDRAGRRRRLRLFRLQEFFRLGLKALAASRRAEEIILALVSKTVLCGLGVDAHAANRIDRDCRAGGFIGIALFSAAAGFLLRLLALMIAGGSFAAFVVIIELRYLKTTSDLY